ncbi:MAG: polysaccharide deacetylase family protein [Thermotogae bacterium]|nr:polysaccharide deacetylase family protein [Thermotogota bacterium]
MDVIIVCHTEFGLVKDKEVVADKNAVDGVRKGVPNLIKVADKYNAKVTFAVMPEVVKYFPKDIKHEIGLHIHPGWQEFQKKGVKFYVGDLYLREHCEQSINSTVLRDYPYKEQLEMIKTGKDYLEEKFGVEPKSFVAGFWSINNDTVKALIKTGITHDCSAPTIYLSPYFYWSKLPRICMPYHPSEEDYQQKGDLPLLIVPISHMFIGGNVNPEVVPSVGLSWLKACFLEYYQQNMPLFHICLHSPCMTDPYFISAMDDFLKFISKHKNIGFKFASEIEEYDEVNPKTKFTPYLFAINRNIMKTGLRSLRSRILGETK